MESTAQASETVSPDRIEFDTEEKGTPEDESEARELISALGIVKPNGSTKDEDADPDEGENFGSFDDYASAMDVRWEGEWEECPFIKGFRVMFGVAEAAQERIARFNDAYIASMDKGRKREKGAAAPTANEIPILHQARIVRQGLFSSSIKDWELKLRGVSVPFTLDNFLHYTEKRYARVARWMLDRLNKRSKLATTQAEADRGKS